MPRGRKKKNSENVNNAVKDFNQLTNPIQNKEKDSDDMNIKPYIPDLPKYTTYQAKTRQELEEACNRFFQLGFKVISVVDSMGMFVIVAERIK